jgi:hypothetical protein
MMAWTPRRGRGFERSTILVASRMPTSCTPLSPTSLVCRLVSTGTLDMPYPRLHLSKFRFDQPSSSSVPLTCRSSAGMAARRDLPEQGAVEGRAMTGQPGSSGLSAILAADMAGYFRPIGGCAKLRFTADAALGSGHALEADGGKDTGPSL